MPNWILGLISTLGGLISGTLNVALKATTMLLSSGARGVMKFHQEGVAFTREMGMGMQQANAYTSALIKNTIELAHAYGVTAEQISKIQRGLADATGKQMLYADTQMEAAVKLSKAVDEGTQAEFSKNIINTMGGGADAVQASLTKSIALGAKSGLAASKFAAKVAQNLQMANKYTFKDGVNGIAKMTALSEKLGFNLQSIGGAVDKFAELDTSIESAAQLQMLGGTFGAYGSNPLTMAYEANYDTEAFTERMANMLKGMATFNTKTGMADVGGMNRQFIQAFAKSVGMSGEEAMSIAKNQATVKYKETHGINRIARGSDGRIDEDLKNLLINRSQVEAGSGRLFVTTLNKETGKQEKQYLDNGLNDNLRKYLEQQKMYADMSDHDILAQIAENTSLQEQIDSLTDSVQASVAQGLHQSGAIDIMQNMVKDLAEPIMKIAKIVGDEIGKIIKTNGPLIAQKIVDTAKWLASNGDKIRDAIGAVASGINFVVKNWPYLIAAIIGAQLVRGISRSTRGASGARPTTSGARPTSGGASPSGGSSPTRGFWGSLKSATKSFCNGVVKAAKAFANGVSKAASFLKGALSKAGSWLKSGWSKMKGLFGSIKNEYKAAAKSAKTSYKVSRNRWNRGALKSARNASRAFFKNAPKLMKGLKGTAGIGTALAAYEAVSAVYDAKKKKEEINSNKQLSERERQEQIAKVNKERNGAIGGAGGGLAGGIAGAQVGALIGSVVPGVGTVIGGVVGGLIGGIGGTFLGEKAGEAIEPHAKGGIVGGTSYNGDKVLAGLNSGEMVLNRTQQAQLFNLANSGVKAKPVGEKEYIYIPKSSEHYNNGKNEITVNDFNININGTIRLDGGNSNTSLDIKKLLDDATFVSQLKDIIKQSINNDMNGGRLMNDIAYRRGGSPSTLWGK